MLDKDKRSLGPFDNPILMPYRFNHYMEMILLKDIHHYDWYRTHLISFTLSVQTHAKKSDIYATQKSHDFCLPGVFFNS